MSKMEMLGREVMEIGIKFELKTTKGPRAV